MNLGKQRKKFVIIGGVLSLALVSLIGYYAITNKKDANANKSVDVSYEDMLPTMEYVAKCYANQFANNYEKDKNIEANEAIPIYDKNEIVMGYSVSLLCDDKSYGYVNINYTDDALVTDFSIGENRESLYDSITNQMVNLNDDIEKEECEEKLYGMDSYVDYAAVAVDKDSGDETYFTGADFYTEDDIDTFDYYEDYYNAALEDSDQTDGSQDDDKKSNNDAKTKTITSGNEDTEENNAENEDIKSEETEENNTENEDTKSEETEENTKSLLKSIKEKYLNWVKKLMPEFYNAHYGSGNYVKPTAYPDVYEAIKDDMQYGNVEDTVMLDCYSKEKSLIKQEDIIDATGTYACSIVALALVCRQNDALINNDIIETYNQLLPLSGAIPSGKVKVDGKDVSCYVVWGDDGLVHTIQSYAKLPEVNRKISAITNPYATFKDFKSVIDCQQSAILTFKAKRTKVGHSVNVVGYCKAQFEEVPVNYLVVGDGWNDEAPRYIQFKRSLLGSASMTIFDFASK